MLATWTGRLRMREQYIANCVDFGAYRTNGFGHMNYAVAELVVESVTDLQPVDDARKMPPADPSIGDERCNPYDNNSRCPTVQTLAQAALYGCLERATAILADSGIDAHDGEPSPALDFAIRGGRLRLVQMLLDAGAPLQPSRSLASPPGFVAVQARQPQILWTLLKAGLDPDARNANGETMLMQAAATGCNACIEVLLNSAANPGLRNTSDKTALDIAREAGNGDAAALLSKAMVR